MKYVHVMFRQVAPGKWELLPKADRLQYWTSLARTKREILENRYNVIRDLSCVGGFGVKHVTRLHNGGDMKGTDKFVSFFDYTIEGRCRALDLGKRGGHVRIREALLRSPGSLFSLAKLSDF